MKFLNLTTSTLAAAVLLTACQGQNPFKRESNPVRDYPKVSESIRTKKGLVPYDHTQPPPAPPPDNSQAICTAPFAVSINGTPGTRLLKFTEDSVTRYEITLINRLGDEFQAKFKAEGVDSGIFRLLKKDSQNKATYQITWNPKRLSSGQFTRVINSGIELSSAALTAHCRGYAYVYLDLLVEKSGQRPSINVSGLPQTPVVFGPQGNLDFAIEVEDRVGGDVPPVLNDIEFKRQAISGGSVIDGVKAVDCQKIPQAISGSNKWKFNCKFISAALENVGALINTNKTTRAVFFVSAQSGHNQVSSPSHQVNISVKFEKVIEAGPSDPSKGAQK